MTSAGQSALYRQFGGLCPVCGGYLGTPVPMHAGTRRFEVPPCFRLEIGRAEGTENHAWRVSVAGANFPPAVSREPFFVQSEVEYVYLLCSDGHIFPEAAPVDYRDGLAADARQRIDRWNMVAAIGAPASGKTYLLVRMLGQELTNPQNLHPANDHGRVRRHHLNPLEEVPMDRRTIEYARTLADRRAIEPTLAEETRPALILEEVIPDAADAIREFIRMTVVDGQARASRWGRNFRQPLVVRTGSGSILTWTGVADLPGELFGPDPGGSRERNKLRSYDALIWVIDPVVAEAALDPLTKESLNEEGHYDKVLDGSLRPGTVAAQGATQVRADRERTQRDIGHRLTLVGNDLAVDEGRALEMLIAVTKCDVIHAALRKHRRLVELGRRDAVRLGVATYLATLTRRFAAGELTTDDHGGALLEYLLGARSAQAAVQERRTYQIADGLLAHYSDQQAFWGLVHEGTKDTVDIPSGGSMATAARRIEVTSIGQHIDQSTVPGSAERMLIRDLVMSALGCGIAFGLGHENVIASILRNDWQRIRLFLCSPLGTVPVGRSAGIPGGALMHRLEPLEPGTRFPNMSESSAALTQLMLAALRKARA